MTTITYTAHALDLNDCDGKPSKTNMPVLVQDGSLKNYLSGGFIVVGQARITVDYSTPAELDAQRLDALKAELQTARAQAQKRENEILDRISKLQAIGYEVEA